jgi:Ca-activated chloride channel homolog
MICPRKILLAALAPALGLLLAQTASVARQQPQQPAPPEDRPTLGKRGNPNSGNQPPPPQSPNNNEPPLIQGPAIVNNVNLVVVPVTVKDGNNQLVADLRREEFRIFEDGVEQKISLFSVDTAPLSVVIAVDDDLKAKSSVEVKKSLEVLAAAFSTADEVAVGRFDAFYTPLLDFTMDNDQLLTELKRMDLNTGFIPNSQPVTTGPVGSNGQPVPGAPGPAQIPNSIGKSTKHINDAVYAAAQLLRTRDSQRRKMIILISDGTNAKYNTHNYEATLRTVLSSNISVYSVGLDSAVILRGTTILSKYAHATGGDVYYATRASELPGFYSRVTEQARHEYTLGYIPSDTDRAKPYHSIEVRIRRPGLALLTRDGYYSIGTP